jgi:hypothetical protein
MISERGKYFTERALVALFVIAVFLSVVNKIGDTDAWLLIWTLQGLPETEPFMYPISDTPFSYNSWLFGLLCYLINTYIGEYGLVLLKAGAITTAFYALLRDSLKPYNNYVVAVVSMTAAAILSSYRFVLRPDIFFMVFLSFSVFSLDSLLYENKKYLYALPLIHVLWANMHASIIVMSVPFMAFIAGGLAQQYLTKRGMHFRYTLSPSQMKTISVVFIASFIATFLTPDFTFHQYFYGPKYLSSSWHMENIIENIFPTNLKLLTYGITAVVLMSFVLNRKQLSLIHLFLVIPFLFLTFGAVRFLIVVAIIGFPIMARNISASLEGKGWKPTRALMVFSAAFIVLFSAVTVSQAVKHKKFGFGLDHSQMPKGAIEYMDRRNIHGRMLNSYTFGQYITWTSYPGRTVFVDARGHLPAELLDKMLEFRYSRRILDELYDEYGFESILTKYANATELHAPSTHPQWALVYWDDVSLLYLRRGGKYDEVIREDEYRFVRPELTPLSLIENPPDKVHRRNLIDELTRNIQEVTDAETSRAHTLLGYAYYSEGEVERALEHLLSAVRIAPRNTSANYGLGILYEKRGDYKTAKKHLKRCLRVERSGELADKAKNRLKELREKTL